MEIPRYWRQRRQRYSLTGEVCPHCEARIFPPRDVCPECGGEAKKPYTFSGKGDVFSYTVMQDAPAGFDDQAPYTVALIKLAEGPMLTAQLTDLGDSKVEIGMKVEMVTRKIRDDASTKGMIIYGYKFRPVLRAN